MKTLQETVYEMLTEDTGTHPLDSGMSESRHWQQNRKKTIDDFYNEPEETIENNGTDEQPDYIRTVSVFHYLAGFGSCLELDDLCHKFNTLNTANEDEGSPFNILADALDAREDGPDFKDGVTKTASIWLDWMMQADDNPAEDWYLTFKENTYNRDCDLSQVLQVQWFGMYGDQYILIQVHNGADVRGGYTNARLFKVNDVDCRINETLDDWKHGDEIHANQLETT